MSKKTTETKTEKRTVSKQPTELRDEQLDSAQGGGYKLERLFVKSWTTSG